MFETLVLKSISIIGSIVMPDGKGVTLLQKMGMNIILLIFKKKIGSMREANYRDILIEVYHGF